MTESRGVSGVSGVSGVRIDRDFCRAEVEPWLRRLVAEVATDCNGLEATLWTLSTDARSLEAAINHGAQTETIEQLSVPLADSVVGFCAESGMSMSIEPGDDHNRSVDAQTGLQTAGMIAAPVRVGHAIVGAVSVINPTDDGVFDDAELETLKWKAYLLELVLDRAVRDASDAGFDHFDDGFDDGFGEHPGDPDDDRD